MVVKVKCKIKLLVISEGAAKMVNMSVGQAGVTGETAGVAEVIAVEAGVTEATAVVVGVTEVSFSSCQRNLKKTFQIEGMIALIAKMDLIFS